MAALAWSAYVWPQATAGEFSHGRHVDNANQVQAAYCFVHGLRDCAAELGLRHALHLSQFTLYMLADWMAVCGSATTVATLARWSVATV